jgi:hypothetical protein
MQDFKALQHLLRNMLLVEQIMNAGTEIGLPALQMFLLAPLQARLTAWWLNSTAYRLISGGGGDGSGGGGGADSDEAQATKQLTKKGKAKAAAGAAAAGAASGNDLFSLCREQSRLEEHKGLFEEYSEMVIQFGHVTLFACACPIAPALALLNNVVEIRGDVLTLAWGKRPFLTSANSTGIGEWMELLDAISFLAVLTNLGVVALHMNALLVFILGSDHSASDRWIIIFAVEHVFIIIVFAITHSVPVTPDQVREAWNKHEAAKTHSLLFHDDHGDHGDNNVLRKGEKVKVH